MDHNWKFSDSPEFSVEWIAIGVASLLCIVFVIISLICCYDKEKKRTDPNVLTVCSCGNGWIVSVKCTECHKAEMTCNSCFRIHSPCDCNSEIVDIETNPALMPAVEGSVPMDTREIDNCPCGSDKIVEMDCEECYQPVMGCAKCWRRLSPCHCDEEVRARGITEFEQPECCTNEREFGAIDCQMAQNSGARDVEIECGEEHPTVVVLANHKGCSCGNKQLLMMKCAKCNHTAMGCCECYRRLSRCRCDQSATKTRKKSKSKCRKCSESAKCRKCSESAKQRTSKAAKKGEVAPVQSEPEIAKPIDLTNDALIECLDGLSQMTEKILHYEMAKSQASSCTDYPIENSPIVSDLIQKVTKKSSREYDYNECPEMNEISCVEIQGEDSKQPWSNWNGNSC